VTAREYLTDKLKGQDIEEITLPVNFEDISVVVGVSMEDQVSGAVSYIRENKKVIPQYTSLLKKIGGMFYGFYYNPCVYEQNDLNNAYLTVCEEFSKQEKIKKELFVRINDLQSRIDELSK